MHTQVHPYKHTCIHQSKGGFQIMIRIYSEHAFDLYMIYTLRTELMHFSQSVVSPEEEWMTANSTLCRNSGVECWWCREAGFPRPLMESQTLAHRTSGQWAWLLLSLVFLVAGNQSPGEIELHSWHFSHHLQFTSTCDSEACFWVASVKRFSGAFRVSPRWSASFSEDQNNSEVTGNWFRKKRSSGHLLPITEFRSLHQRSGF